MERKQLYKRGKFGFYRVYGKWVVPDVATAPFRLRGATVISATIPPMKKLPPASTANVGCAQSHPRTPTSTAATTSAKTSSRGITTSLPQESTPEPARPQRRNPPPTLRHARTAVGPDHHHAARLARTHRRRPATVVRSIATTQPGPRRRCLIELGPRAQAAPRANAPVSRDRHSRTAPQAPIRAVSLVARTARTVTPNFAPQFAPSPLP